METKRCTRCKVEKLRTEFYKSKSQSGGYRYECKKCSTILKADYTRRNPKKNCEASKAWAKRNPDKIRANSFAQSSKRSGITDKEHRARLAKKKGERAQDIKQCTRCKTTKPTSEFYGLTNDRGHKYLAAECKACAAGRSNEWREKNPEKANASARESQRRYRRAHPEESERKWRTSAYKKFGITVDDYDKMFKAQNGVCKICELPQSGRFKHLAVDHDHETGKVRGLLCMTCNRNLGYVERDNRLRRILEYLKK